LRLLLDEMCSPVIAVQLRHRGHDAVASAERADLRGLPDDELLSVAAADRRALATFDEGDFAQLATRYQAEERTHHGVILMSARRFSPAAEGVGPLVDALDALLVSRPSQDALRNEVVWLQRATAT
jgi:hypothetical protein